MFIDIIPLNESSERMVVDMMNGEYSKAILCYVQYYANRPEAFDAILQGITTTNITISFKENVEELKERDTDSYKPKKRRCCKKMMSWIYGVETDNQEARTMTERLLSVRDAEAIVRLPSPCSTVGDARRVLVAMARESSQALGVEMDLPPENKGSAPSFSSGFSSDQAREMFSRPPPQEMIEQISRMAGVPLPPELKRRSVAQGSQQNQPLPSAPTVPRASRPYKGLDENSPICEIRIQSSDGASVVRVNMDHVVQDLRCILDGTDGKSAHWKPYELLGGVPRRPLNATSTFRELGIVPGGRDMIIQKYV